MQRDPKNPTCPGKTWLLELLLPVGIELLQGHGMEEPGHIHGRWVLARGFGAQSSLLLFQQGEEGSCPSSPLS